MALLSLAAELDFARIAPLKVFSIVRRLLHKHGMPSNWMVEDRCHLVPKMILESYVPFSRPGLAWPGLCNMCTGPLGFFLNSEASGQHSESYCQAFMTLALAARYGQSLELRGTRVYQPPAAKATANVRDLAD